MTLAVVTERCTRCGVAVEDIGLCVRCYDAQVDMSDDVKARKRAYAQQPEVKARKRGELPVREPQEATA